MKQNRVILYYKLQCKRIFHQLPHIFLGILLLGTLIGMISFFTGKLLYVNQHDGNLQVAYTSDDENKMTNMFLNILTNSNSISSTCKFINTSQENANELLQKEQILAAIYIPPNFMDGLKTAENYAITISLPQHLTLYSVIMVEMMNAVDTTLSAAQAGVYTLYDYYKEHDLLEKEKAANRELNSIYLTQALNRSSTFQTKTVSATGDVSLGMHLLCGGIVLIILLLGCSFAELVQICDRTIFTQKLLLNGITIRHLILSRIVAVTLVLYSISASGLLIYWICNNIKRWNSAFLGIGAFGLGLLNGFFICLCSASLIVCILSFSNNRSTGILLLFLVVSLCGFLSGCLIPSLFLPDIARTIGECLPTTFLLRTCKDLLNPCITAQNILALLLNSVCSCGISIGICWFRLKKEFV